MIASPKLMIMGYGEHGKDTVCKIINQLYGLTSISSSYFANEIAVYPFLKDLYGYQNPQECYDDRHNHRDEWFRLIKKFNTPDECRLAREIYQQHNGYNGVRDINEFTPIKTAKLFDWSIWVDALERKPPESAESCTVSREDADVVLSNNGAIEETTDEIIKLMSQLYPKLSVIHDSPSLTF